MKDFEKIDNENIIVDSVKYTTFENESCDGCAFDGVNNDEWCRLVGQYIRPGKSVSWKRAEPENLRTSKFVIGKDEEFVSATEKDGVVTITTCKTGPSREDKQLLIKDLCARLPYGIFVHDENTEDHILTYTTDYHPKLGELKPYLRPMYAMTEGEREKQLQLQRGLKLGGNIDMMEDFYHSHYIDYMGLIDKGLALEAPEGMYKPKI